MDGEKRSCNVIITGLSEADIKISETSREVDLTTDYEKVIEILRIMECYRFTVERIMECYRFTVERIMECYRFTVGRIMEFEIKRLGKPREGYNRALRVILPATEYRVEFLKNSKMLKDASDIWKKVYVKKDLHPVYVAENTRLRKEYYTLFTLPKTRVHVKNITPCLRYRKHAFT